MIHGLRFPGFLLRDSANQPRQSICFEVEFLGGVPASLRGLPLQGRKLLLDLDVDVIDAGKIDFGGFEFGLREAPLGFEFRDSCGFFDDGAPVGRFRTENLANAALLDDRVGVRAEPDPHE